MSAVEAAAVRHRRAMEAVAFAAQLLTPHHDPLAALVEAERGMHSYLHVVDPTLYRRAINDRGLEQQVRLARAALAFIQAVQEVKAELLEGGEREG